MTRTKMYSAMRGLALSAAILSVSLLAACAGSNTTDSDSAARFLVAPGKYTLFNCAQLAVQSKTTVERQHELEGLMAKAGTTSGGEVVNAIAYRPEYVTLRGEMMDLRQAALDKKCKFVPGESPVTGDVSGQVVR
jgi:hypothetical protein